MHKVLSIGSRTNCVKLYKRKGSVTVNDLAQAIWTKMNEDQEFASQPEALRRVLLPYVEVLPELLVDLLPLPASLNNIMKAKVLFLRHCVEKGFIKSAVEAIPLESLGFFSRNEMAELLESTMAQLIDMAEELTGDVTQMLQDYGMTEEDVMLGPNLGLNDEARALYQSGELTIEKLLLTQPHIIVKNSK